MALHQNIPEQSWYHCKSPANICNKNDDDVCLNFLFYRKIMLVFDHLPQVQDNLCWVKLCRIVDVLQKHKLPKAIKMMDPSRWVAWVAVAHRGVGIGYSNYQQ
jgi:hypothetical protein